MEHDRHMQEEMKSLRPTKLLNSIPGSNSVGLFYHLIDIRDELCSLSVKAQ